VRSIRVLVVLLLLVAACADDGAISTSTTTTTVAAATTVTTAASTTTTSTSTTTTTTASTTSTTSTSTTSTTTVPAGPGDGYHTGLIHFVNLGDAVMSFDPVTWVWTGPADTEGYWTNDDQTPYLIPIAAGATVMACPDDMSGSFPAMLYCQPDEFVTHTVGTLALWVHNGIEVGQNRRWMAEIPGHNGQLWNIVVAGGEVIEINGVWWP
jgi:hypothetical protein